MDVSQRRRSESEPASSSRRARLTEPNWASKLLLVVVIVAALLLIVTMAVGLLRQNANLVKEDQYQAVFLSNGQVYFGKLSSVNSRYAVLRSIYYLQQDQNLQSQQQQSQQNLKLTKLGSELHGPEDEMFIDNDKILFWENLKNDSKIVQTIQGKNQ